MHTVLNLEDTPEEIPEEDIEFTDEEEDSIILAIKELQEGRGVPLDKAFI